jgi:hypothetical protein
MKQRILSGWNVRRILYLLVGAWIMIQSVIDHQWILAVAGAYFAAMGVFAFGCAGGSCAVNPPVKHD